MYGNDLAFTQTYTSLHGMWKSDDLWYVWINIFSTNN